MMNYEFYPLLTLFIIIGQNIVKRIWQFEVHTPFCHRVNEGDGTGLKIETVTAMAIEFVAEDGTAEAVLVGAVHAQLMGAPGVWPEGEEGETFPGPSCRRGTDTTKELVSILFSPYRGS